MAKISVQKTDVTILQINETDYVSLTDIAKYKTNDSFIVVCNWMRNRNTKEEEQKLLGWSAKRELAELNYQE